MADQVDLEVPEALDGARVDRAVADLLGLSRSKAAAVVAVGVEVGGAPAKGSDRVSTGTIIRCWPPEDSEDLAPESVDFAVLFEDGEMIVVDKPAGVVVHPGSGRTEGTLAAGLIDRYPELVGVGTPGRWGLVHRLDKGTSGVMLVARTEGSFDFLVAELRRRNIGRTYTALVEGKMSAATGTIDAPVGRDPANPTRRAVTPGGKHARTNYEVDRYFAESNVSLLKVTLETGRTHQIRVHLAAIGHPVVGDVAYGAGRTDLDAARTLLHASRLDLTHPVSGERISIEAPLPTDMATVLERLA